MAFKRRRHRRMLELFRSTPTWPQEHGETEKQWGTWESDVYAAGRLLSEAEKDEPFDARWNNWRSQPSGGPSRARKWVLQGLFSLALVAAVWLIETSTHPRMATVQYWVSEAVTRDFDFAAVQAWYERQFDGSSALLPAFASQWFSASSRTSSVEWRPPNGRVVQPFSAQHQGVRLAADGAGEVHAVGTGWVIDVGERPTLGLTVVIQHPQGNQTWYARLQEVYVSKEDWVYAGDPIGRTGPDGEWFLALRQRDAFVDPVAVLPPAE